MVPQCLQLLPDCYMVGARLVIINAAGDDDNDNDGSEENDGDAGDAGDDGASSRRSDGEEEEGSFYDEEEEVEEEEEAGSGDEGRDASGLQVLNEYIAWRRSTPDFSPLTAEQAVMLLTAAAMGPEVVADALDSREHEDAFRAFMLDVGFQSGSGSEDAGF
jgi:hypothetical protein